jgi:hypothetical protein
LSQNWALVPNQCPRRNAVSPLIARLKGLAPSDYSATI